MKPSAFTPSTGVSSDRRDRATGTTVARAPSSDHDPPMIPRSAVFLTLVLRIARRWPRARPARLARRTRTPTSRKRLRPPPPAAPRASRARSRRRIRPRRHRIRPYSTRPARAPPPPPSRCCRRRRWRQALARSRTLSGIAQAFFFVTFVPQNFWLLLVFAPNWKWTRRIFEPLWPLCVVALAHLYIVGASAGKPPEAGTAPLVLQQFVQPGGGERARDRRVRRARLLPQLCGRGVDARAGLGPLRRPVDLARGPPPRNLHVPQRAAHQPDRAARPAPPRAHGAALRLLSVRRPDGAWADPEALRTELEVSGRPTVEAELEVRRLVKARQRRLATTSTGTARGNGPRV